MKVKTYIDKKFEIFLKQSGAKENMSKKAIEAMKETIYLGGRWAIEALMINLDENRTALMKEDINNGSNLVNKRHALSVGQK